MKRPKVGLALGSGGARGYAHIGVLKVLHENGIPIDYLAGCSMGSVIAVFYANDINIHLLEKLAVQMKRNQFTDYTVPRLGLIKGNRIQELVQLLTHGKNFEDLSIPTSVVATNIVNGERVIFDSGPVDLAVRASISIPGIFEPVTIGNQVLVDGGLVDRVPVSILQEMGADIIIAVDVSPKKFQTEIRSIYDVIFQSLEIMERQIMNMQGIDADVVIRPNVSHYGTIDFSEVETIIKEGEESTLPLLPKIKRLIKEWGSIE